MAGREFLWLGGSEHKLATMREGIHVPLRVQPSKVSLPEMDEWTNVLIYVQEREHKCVPCRCTYVPCQSLQDRIMCTAT